MSVEAHVSGASRGPYSFAWSGCASGSGPRADCLVVDLDEHVASVRVTDRDGIAGDASTTLRGANEAPRFEPLACVSHTPPCAGGVRCPAGVLLPATIGTCRFDGPDTDGDGDSWRCRSLRVEGACREPRLRACGGVGDAIEIDVQADARPGRCAAVLR